MEVSHGKVSDRRDIVGRRSRHPNVGQCGEDRAADCGEVKSHSFCQSETLVEFHQSESGVTCECLFEVAQEISPNGS